MKIFQTKEQITPKRKNITTKTPGELAAETQIDLASKETCKTGISDYIRWGGILINMILTIINNL